MLLSVILTVLFVIVSVLLILIVLIQDEDGSSLGGVFAGSSNTAFGSRSASVVVKFTYVLGAMFFILAISLAFINRSTTVPGTLSGTKESTATEWWKPSTTSTEATTPAPTTDATTTPAADAAALEAAAPSTTTPSGQ